MQDNVGVRRDVIVPLRNAHKPLLLVRIEEASAAVAVVARIHPSSAVGDGEDIEPTRPVGDCAL